jgi:hypothetical protein
MFTISGHKGNANQNHTKNSPHPVRIAIIKNTTTQMLAKMQGKRHAHTVLVGIQTSITTLENNMEAS